MKKRSLESTLYLAGWIGSIALIPVCLFYRYFWIPRIHLPCVLDAFFGIYCPGCGGTRAAAALLHGHLLLSLWYHPLVLYTAVIWGGFMITQTLERLKVPHIKAWHFHDWYLYGAMALLFGNCVLKNILRLCFHICM